VSVCQAEILGLIHALDHLVDGKVLRRKIPNCTGQSIGY